MKENHSRYFPPSAQDFERKIEQLKKQNEALQETYGQLLERMENVIENGVNRWPGSTEQLQQFGETVDELHRETDQAIRGVENQVRQLAQRCAGMETKTDILNGRVAAIYQREFPLDVRFERMYYKDFPVCTSQETPDFQIDCLSLVDGLDEKSVETVVLALQRLKLIQNSEEPAMALYSVEEKQVMSQLFEHFYSNVLELSESCYFYRGYMLPVNHFEPCVFWDKCGVPFLEHPERFADRDIIDAGAFIGDSALILSQLTVRKVYAFEPTPSNFKLLTETIELNERKNIVPCDFALGEKSGVISISPSINSNGSCSTQFENAAFSYAETVEVKSTTVDEFVKEHDLHIGLIKADVEGAEQLLLRGAMETIKTQKPAMLISIYHNASDFFKIKPMLEDLHLGYKFKIRHPISGTVMTETVLIAEVP